MTYHSVNLKILLLDDIKCNANVEHFMNIHIFDLKLTIHKKVNCKLKKYHRWKFLHNHFDLINYFSPFFQKIFLNDGSILKHNQCNLS